MRIQSPLTPIRRFIFTTQLTSKIKSRRLIVLLSLTALAAIALTASVSSSASLRQLTARATSARRAAKPAQSKAAAVDPSLTGALAQSAGSSLMTTERRAHTATILSDGRVLIVGGENAAGGYQNSAEIFDPATNSFSQTGSLAIGRADHAAVRLADGRVLITGGRTTTGATNTTEIFDSAAGAFTSGPAMSVARSGNSATLFADGRVLIAGGDENGSAEIFDPSTGSFGTAGANLITVRSKHSAALLSDGRVLIVGGMGSDGSALSSGEIFDPTTSTFSGIGGMEVARVRPLLRVLFDGKVQIIGGTDDRSMEIYDPAAGIFGGYAQVPPDGDLHLALIDEVMAAPTRAALLTGGQTITELGSSALAAGGVDASGNATSASTIYPSSGASVSSDKIDYLPGTQVIITGHGFHANENVTLTFHEYPHIDTAELHTFSVQADGDGNFTFDQYSPELADLGITYILGAKGETSGKTAQTTFHDSVNVTAGSGGTNISADKAANATSPGFTTLGDIVVSEGVNNDFPVQSNTTLIVTAPSGWLFNPGVGSTQTTKSGPGTNELNDNSITVTSSTITVNITVTGTGQINTLSIKGIQVRATDGANVPGSGNILRTVGNPGTATITGVINGSTNFGSLSQAAGAINKLVVTLPTQTFADGTTVATSGNSGSVSNQISGTPFAISKLTATDQFFNIVIIYSGAKTISYSGPGTNAGFPAPSYTAAVSFTNGQSTTILTTTLRKAETTTITATDGTTAGPASSNLTVNAGTLASFVVTNTSDANIGTQTAGTPFDIKVRAADASGNTDTTFNANGFKVNITSSSGTLSAGGGTTDAFTNGVLSPWSVTFSTSGTYPGSFSLTATGIGGSSGISGTSNNFTVNGPPCTTPSVSTQPTNQTVTYGAASAVFTAAATGTPAPTVQWQQNTGSGFTNIGGATTTTLTINNPTVAMSGTQYRAVFTNTCGSVNTNAATLTVDKATPTATLAVNNSPQTYNGSAKAATVGITTSSVPGTVANVVTGGAATQTTAGSYAVTADFVPNDTTNYNTLTGLSAGNFVIDKATPTATLAVNNSPQTYNGSAKAATVIISVSSVPGTVANIMTGGAATHTTAGTYAVTADFVPNDTTNYNTLTGLSAGNFVIDKADANCSISGYSVTYNGAAHTATGQCTGIDGPSDVLAGLDLSNTTHTNAGNYNGDPWTFTDSTGNYNNSHGTVDNAISQASSTVTVTCGGPYVYTAAAQTPCIAQATGAGMSAVDVSSSLTYSNNTNVGAATADASWSGDTNHTGNIGAGGFSITQATSTVTVTCTAGAPYVYTGSPHTPCTAQATGVGLSPIDVTSSLVYFNNTNAGSATANGSWGGDANHFGNTGSGGFTISKASSTTTVTATTLIFDGLPHGGTATVTGAGGLNQSVTPVYYTGRNTTVYPSSTTAPSSPGDYTASATFTGDSNHNGSAGTADFSIGKWNLTGFYQPVDMSPIFGPLVFNIVKGGSTVPLKFNVYAGTPALTTERKSVADIKSFQYVSISCTATAAIETALEITTTGGTVLRYDTTAGQFIQNWQTPNKPGVCYQVRMTAQDGTYVDAFFKTK
jgi:hypothetical protein